MCCGCSGKNGADEQHEKMVEPMDMKKFNVERKKKFDAYDRVFRYRRIAYFNTIDISKDVG